jgi:hypothetical protein
MDFWSVTQLKPNCMKHKLKVKIFTQTCLLLKEQKSNS